MIHYSEKLLEREEEGVCRLILVAVRYTGSKDNVPPDSLEEQAAWPGDRDFTSGDPVAWDTGDGITEDKPKSHRHVINTVEREPGPWQIGLVPDAVDEELPDTGRDVTSIEQADDWEVSYDPSVMAEAFLNRNYLPARVFHNGHDSTLRDIVFDQFDIEDRGVVDEPGDETEQYYREQLVEIADIDDDGPATNSEMNEAEEIASRYFRPELMSAASDLGIDNANQSKSNLAEYIVQQEDYEQAFEE